MRAVKIYKRLKNGEEKIHEFVKEIKNNNIRINDPTKINQMLDFCKVDIKSVKSFFIYSYIEIIINAFDIREGYVFQNALDIAEDISDGYYKAEALSSIALALSQSGQPQEAEKQFDKAIAIACDIVNDFSLKKSKVRVLSSIALALSQSGQPQEAEKQFDKAFKEVNDLQEDYLKSESLRLIVDNLKKSASMQKLPNLFGKAIAIAEDISDGYYKAEAISSIALALSQSGQPRSTQKQFDKAIAIAEEIYDNSNNARVLSSIALALSQSGQPQEAQKQFDKAINHIEYLNNRSLISLESLDDALKYFIQSLSESNDATNVLRLVNKTFDIAEKTDDESKDLVLFTIIEFLEDFYRILDESGRQPEARQLVDHFNAIIKNMGDFERQSDAFFIVAMTLLHAGHLDEAHNLVNKSILIHDIRLMDSSKSESLSIFTKFVVESSSIKNRTMILKKAIAIAEDISDAYDRFEALSSIALALSQSGQPQEAEKQFDKAFKEVNDSQDDYLKSASLSFIGYEIKDSAPVQNLSRILKKAIAITKGMDDSGCIAEALSSIALALSQSGQPQEAEKQFDKAIEFGKRIGDDNAKSQCFSFIVYDLIESVNTENLSRILRKAIAIAEDISNASYKQSALFYISKSLAQSNNLSIHPNPFEKAIAIAENMSDGYYKAASLSSIALALSQSGQPQEAEKQFDKAIAIAENISTSYFAYHLKVSFESSLLGSLFCTAKSLAQSNNLSIHPNPFERAIAIAENISDAYDKAEALSSIALALSQSGQPQEAEKQFDKAIAIAKNISTDDNNRIDALLLIVRILFLTGQSQVGQVHLDKVVTYFLGGNSHKSDAHLIKRIIGIQIEFNLNISVEIIDLIDKDFAENILDIISQLNVPSENFWILINRCLGYPQIVYSICSLMGKCYPDIKEGLAELIIKHQHNY